MRWPQICRLERIIANLTERQLQSQNTAARCAAKRNVKPMSQLSTVDLTPRLGGTVYDRHFPLPLWSLRRFLASTNEFVFTSALVS